MRETRLETKSLNLIPMKREDVLAEIEAMGAAEKAQVSAEWLKQLRGSSEMDPWIHGFSLTLRETGESVGRCGFKGPPTKAGVVEIAYGVDPAHQRKGFATEAAEALVQFAYAGGSVQIVRAHTLPEANASTRVLTKCGFRFVGEVIDPEDGRVWRWEKRRDHAG